MVEDDYPKDWKAIYTRPVLPQNAPWPATVARNSRQAAEDRVRAKESYIRWERARKRRKRAIDALVIVLLLSIGVCCLKVVF